MRLALVLALGFALAGCTQMVDAPQPRAEPVVAPITATQAVDLLSPDVQNDEGNLFVTVDPEECAPVAREVNPPFIFDHQPAATHGGHWVADDGREVFVEEMIAVYRATYDPRNALAEAKRAIESCRDVPFTVTTMRGREHAFNLLPPVESGSPAILLWSFAGADWACDSALVAAHNAAAEITTCAEVNGYDVLSLAEGTLKRIETLANMAA